MNDLVNNLVKLPDSEFIHNLANITHEFPIALSKVDAAFNYMVTFSIFTTKQQIFN